MDQITSFTHVATCTVFPCIGNYHRCLFSSPSMVRLKSALHSLRVALTHSRFSPSIVIMQASVIFVPFFQIFKHRKLATETRDIIAEWEEKQKFGSINTCSTKKGHQSLKSTVSTRQGVLYTMSALERALKLDPTGLLMFSALKDFSGENISFLIHVRDWKASWSTKSCQTANLRKQTSAKAQDPALVRRQFQQAVGIYASFVSFKYSEFPINISSTHLKDLEATFERFAALVCAEATINAATTVR